MMFYYLLILLCFYTIPLYTIREKPHNKTTFISSNKPNTLKSLSANYGARIAYALYTLSKEKFPDKERKFVERLTHSEKIILLKAVWLPSQIGYAMVALLSPEMSNHIASFIDLPILHYRSLQPSSKNILKNARILSFHPTIYNEMLFTSNNFIKKLHENTITTIADSPNIPDITKMIYHPTNDNVIITKRNKNLALYENGLFTIWDGMKIKDFAVSSQQNQLLVYPESLHVKENLLFDLNQKSYSTSTASNIIVSPDSTHVVSDPHNSNTIADINRRSVRIVDLENQKIKSVTQINHNHGKCLFDPHHPNVMAYISGRFLRIIDLYSQKQCASLKHASPIVDFDYNPHKPHQLLVTQKNGQTIEWNKVSSKKNAISLMQVMQFLKKGKLPS